VYSHGFDEIDYPNGVVKKVTEYICVQTSSGTHGWAKFLFDNGELHESSPVAINEGFKTFSYDFTDLKENWSWDDIRDCKFGVSLRGGLLQCSGCTQVYLEVEYTPLVWSAMTSDTTVQLNSVWGSSSSNVFAVGASGTIRKYDGTSWSGSSSGTIWQLNGVWGSSASNVFAVGNGGTIRKYNGTSWSGMTSGTTKNLYGVWGTGANDVFAVGDSGTVLHYNGIAWSTMNSSVTTALYGIWGSSFDNVFAVGASGKIIQYK
jgi:hypothetical protein